jgi:putative phosphoesterase
MSQLLIAVISDTHLPKGKRRLPERCAEAIAAADVAIHAGDFSTLAVLREIEALGTPVHAVHGNVDDAGLRRLLPESLEVELGGRTIAVVHDAGPARGRLQRLRARFPQADAVVFGHSHLPLHERDGKFQIFNPGSPTERRRAPRRSFGMLSLGLGGTRFRHLWLDPD